DVVPSVLLVRGDLGLLLLPDQRRQDALAKGRLARGPRLEDGKEESLDLREEDILVECHVVRLDGGDAGKLAVDAITIDVRFPRPSPPRARAHVPVRTAAPPAICRPVRPRHSRNHRPTVRRSISRALRYSSP